MYYSIAIIGVQNSGKSTLLNALFGTKFSVLKTIAGTRTTRGILISLDKIENLIIMDVEGNDAIDRSEDQDYQKMVSSFALVSANVLLINIWSKSLGQFTGSQYESLTIIIDVCMNQFKEQCPKTILFCVRDFNEQYDNYYEIERKIQNDVRQIWNRIQKPKELQKYSNSPQKFYTLKVATLRRFRQNKPEQFLQDITQLRQIFINVENDEYIFKRQKIQYNLPINDLSILYQNSWKSIRQNNKLNLPSQKQQLSNFRCNQISQQVKMNYYYYEQIINQFYQEIKLGYNQDKNWGQIELKYIKKFQQKTIFYKPTIIENKLQELKITINQNIIKIINNILEQEINNLQQQFINSIQNVYENITITLKQQLNNFKDKSIEKLSNLLNSMNYNITNRKERIIELTQKLNKIIIQMQIQTIKIMQQNFWFESKQQIKLLTSDLICNNFGILFWIKVVEQFKKKQQKLIQIYKTKIYWIQNRQIQPIQYDNIQEKLENQIKKCIKQDLENTLVNRLFQIFIQNMIYDNQNNKRNFTIIQQIIINQIFDKQRDSINQLIKIINQYNLESTRKSSIIDCLDEKTKQLFDSTCLAKISGQIDKRMIDEYEKIIRRKKQGQMKKVPKILILVILYFVYDDLWFSEKGYPIIHTIILLLTTLFISFYAIGEGGVLSELFNIAKDRLSGIMNKIKN